MRSFYDSNDKFLNEQKLIQPKQKYTFVRCPSIEHVSSFLESQVIEPPQKIVIHIGTNDLSITTPMDEFVSDLSVLLPQVSTEFPKSKSSTLLFSLEEIYYPTLQQQF